eukprot:2609344-Prymnesium_polylepis.1
MLALAIPVHLRRACFSFRVRASQVARYGGPPSSARSNPLGRALGSRLHQTVGHAVVDAGLLLRLVLVGAFLLLLLIKAVLGKLLILALLARVTIELRVVHLDLRRTQGSERVCANRNSHALIVVPFEGERESQSETAHALSDVASAPRLYCDDSQASIRSGVTHIPQGRPVVDAVPRLPVVEAGYVVALQLEVLAVPDTLHLEFGLHAKLGISQRISALPHHAECQVGMGVLIFSFLPIDPVAEQHVLREPHTDIWLQQQEDDVAPKCSHEYDRDVALDQDEKVSGGALGLHCVEPHPVTTPFERHTTVALRLNSPRRCGRVGRDFGSAYVAKICTDRCIVCSKVK